MVVPLVGAIGITTTYSHRVVIELLQWYKIYKLSEDKLHKPIVVALKVDLELHISPQKM